MQLSFKEVDKFNIQEPSVLVQMRRGQVQRFNSMHTTRLMTLISEKILYSSSHNLCFPLYFSFICWLFSNSSGRDPVGHADNRCHLSLLKTHNSKFQKLFCVP